MSDIPQNVSDNSGLVSYTPGVCLTDWSRCLTNPAVFRVALLQDELPQVASVAVEDPRVVGQDAVRALGLVGERDGMRARLMTVECVIAPFYKEEGLKSPEAMDAFLSRERLSLLYSSAHLSTGGFLPFQFKFA